MRLCILAVFLVWCGGELEAARLRSTNVCDGLRPGEVVANPEDCNSYIVCAAEGMIVHYCERGLHYEAERKICNWPIYANCAISSTDAQVDSEPKDDNPTGLNKQLSIFAAIDRTTGRATDPMATYDPEHVECRHFGAYFLPHPHICRQYFVCAYGYMHLHKCGDGTLWDYRRAECQLDATADCYVKSDEELLEIEQLQDAQTLATGCNGASAGVTSDDTTIETTTVVTSSWYPTNGTWQPTGSYYTATALSSGTTAMPASQHINTNFSPATTPIPPTPPTPQTPPTTPSPPTPPTETIIQTTTAATATPITIPTMEPTGNYTTTGANQGASTPRIEGTILACPSESQAYLPHPDDCSKYYICIMGMPVLTSCPQGLRWDQKAEFCDLIGNVECNAHQQQFRI